MRQVKFYLHPSTTFTILPHLQNIPSNNSGSSMKTHSTRRHFIKQSACAFAGTTLLAACAGKPKSRWRFFTDKEANLVDIITEQIIPTDDSPGAIEAGCLNFIDKQLVGYYQRHQQDYRNGLICLEKTCAAEFNRSFAELDWDSQTALLEKLQAGDVDEALWPDVSSSAFFQLVRDFTIQGFYGSPRHGGNKKYISYKMLELDMPHIIGQNRYTQGMDKPNGWIEGVN
jgi:gluconate 2-dehydrogenase gamma chain